MKSSIDLIEPISAVPLAQILNINENMAFPVIEIIMICRRSQLTQPQRKLSLIFGFLFG